MLSESGLKHVNSNIVSYFGVASLMAACNMPQLDESMPNVEASLDSGNKPTNSKPGRTLTELQELRKSRLLNVFSVR